MSSELEQLLTQGLRAGYVGKTEHQAVERGPFKLETSQFSTPEGVYRDEWMTSQTGGGQEIAQVGNQTVTRLYAGGVIKSDQLTEMGLSEKDVIGYLKRKILEHGGRTRLYKECNPGADGEWQYAYQILYQIENPPLTIAVEEITFRGKRVFTHGFLLSPVD